MKRLYRITLIAEREFERTATRKAKETRDDLVRFAESRNLWTVKSARISNRAMPERTPKAPTDGETWDSIAAYQAIALMQGIADDMARILGNVKKPRLAWSPNRFCEGASGRRAVAHSHNSIGRKVRYFSGPRKGRVIPQAAEASA